MSLKVYRKDIKQSFSSSIGRFLSLFSLMMIGAIALIGLKVTAPNMERTAQTFIEKYHTMDLSIIGSQGFNQDDKNDLKKLKDTKIEYSYLLDVTTNNGQKAIRLFSTPKNISKAQLSSGHFPKTKNEIALAKSFSKQYHIGDTISFSDTSNLLSTKTYQITGFIQSSEMWSTKNLGSSSKGSGELQGYGIIPSASFKLPYHNIARIQIKSLNQKPYYSDTYKDKVTSFKSKIKKRLSDNGEKRQKHEVSEANEKINKAKSQLSKQEKTIKQLPESPQKSQLTSQLNQEKAKISRQETKISQIKAATYSVYNRKTYPGSDGYTAYDSSTESISAVGNIFPVVLYIVAALVTLTTMTRFVDEERQTAGLFKALGYSNKQIIRKFIIYGFITSMAGTLAGVIIGHIFLSPMISNIITNTSVIGESHRYFYLSWTLLALLFAFISAVLPTYLVARKELSDEAAPLLLAKPPVAGETILLEKWHFIWNKLSFTQKITARNIFRYKQRMFMTIFGVAGSVALLFAGLGIQTSISGVSKTQFQDILNYQLIVSENQNATKSEQEKLNNALESSDITHKLPIEVKTSKNKISTVNEEQSITMFISDQDQLSPYINLRERHASKAISLPKNGIVISEKLAQLYKADIGDTIKITLNHKKVTVKIAAITEMYAGHFIFFSKQYYENISHQTFKENAKLVQLNSKKIRDISYQAASFNKLKAVAGVSQNASLIAQLNAVANSLQSVMLILVILSVLLAIVILYNLTNINVAERIRELSTIKVLGFHNKEVTLYIYRETIVLSIIGIIAGLISGIGLHALLLNMIGSDVIMFNPSVPLKVYIIPIIAISAILICLGLVVNRHLRKVDMLEALKSVD
ncbi:hypothetical protein HMPREF9318_01720 [Streptococcus urinalis FB127-CNA-2]|uniref:Efflux ABC transporter, permease protein n=1 Tax=Streptococcus urinalis 2285-97 TaxID=764291 RepID=G5KEC6_9STRE|nr:ABC transporter permease [Streptococcus urinalis]EHJ56210.1 efflux ABC transporter, permease protein [Streptococcus urinalis 2285-97]EKS18221.1 hypothetical protein HMPREF9318_01720 [Streptococcus urinalis FB127-CNA-2]VEF32904.1 ABC transporter permease [Streptococcus urinalis]